ncbi:MAG: hypothetical protein EBY40_00225 [Marivivens sp.]|nr:hypothetical protein [Marivivens sp.]NCW67034.1 hypothetical protein [Marivivens sp.]NDH01535.1 hypothetical protein [Marivivens sp.]
MAEKYTELTLDSGVYTNTANWVGGVAPVATDDVFFQFGATQAMTGSDQSATELGDIEVSTLCAGNAGSADTYLQLDQATSAKTVFAGSGIWYLDLGTSGSAEVRIDKTRAASGGSSSLYFKNNTNAITLMTVASGNVRLVDANITTLVVREGATVYIDEGCTVTNIHNEGGDIIDYGSTATTWYHRLGTSTKYGNDAVNLNMYGGTFYNDGTGTITASMYGGLLDVSRDNRSKTVNATMNGGTLKVGPNVTLSETINTITTISA